MIKMRWYRILGITPEMYKAMEGTFLDEIIAYMDGNKVHVTVPLTLFEAAKLKREIKKFNQVSENKLELVRM